MHMIVIGLLSAGLFVLASLAAVSSFGHFAAQARGKPSHALPASDDGTTLDRVVVPLLEDRDGQTGLTMLSDNVDAFAARALAARNAGRSLDLMYYIWHDDLTGKLLAREVLAAADRGVRVRLLLDDINARGKDGANLALDSHPNISVRLFNPSRARQGALRRGLEMALRALTVTRRMHNKAWIADGRVSIVGGRNIGDEYFDASKEANFHDLDLLLVGSGVGQSEAVFDDFWNSAVALPIHAMVERRRRPDLERVRHVLAGEAERNAAHPYLKRVRERLSVAELIGPGKIAWSPSARIISDPPEKALNRNRENWLMGILLPAIASSQRSLEITSPYFIPGQTGTARLAEWARQGIDVAILTNSLAATDVVAVHGAYARYRKDLVASGIRLFELQPNARTHDGSLFGSSGASLHTKAFTVDDHAGFIGSFNFDPRSASLNTEMGVLFVQPQIVMQMRRLFAGYTAPQASYRLQLDGDALHWHGAGNGRPIVYDKEPEAGLLMRLAAALVGLLPIESQL